MSILAWAATASVVVAAVLLGHTASGRADRPGGQRAVAVSVTGPVVVGVLGLLLASATGQWLAVAAGTVGAVAAVAVAGLVLTP